MKVLTECGEKSALSALIFRLLIHLVLVLACQWRTISALTKVPSNNRSCELFDVTLEKNSASACDMINDIGRQFIHIFIMKSTPSGMEKGLHQYPFPKRKPHRDRSMACLSGAALKQTRIVENDTIGQFNLLSLSPCMCTCIMSYDSSLIDLFFHLYWIFILWLLPKHFSLWCFAVRRKIFLIQFCNFTKSIFVEKKGKFWEKLNLIWRQVRLSSNALKISASLRFDRWPISLPQFSVDANKACLKSMQNGEHFVRS